MIEKLRQRGGIQAANITSAINAKNPAAQNGRRCLFAGRRVNAAGGVNLADRIHVLDYGRTIAEGAPASVLTDPAVLAAYLGTAVT